MGSAPTTIVFVNQSTRDAYARQISEIDRRYPYDGPPEGVSLIDHWANLAALRAAARVEIRDAMRIAAKELIFGPDEWRYAIAI
jgi:hypothetical protein